MISAGCRSLVRPGSGAAALLSGGIALGLVLLAGAVAAQPPAGDAPDPARSAAINMVLQTVTAPEAGSRSVDAQTAFHNGRLAERSGSVSAARGFFEDAARIDPTFAEPHFALAGTWLPFRIDRALHHATEGVQTSWKTFRGQHRLAMNAALVLLLILCFTLVATATLTVVRGLGYLQHPIFEVIRRRLPVPAAAVAAWILVAQPLLWGIGLFLLVTIGLGLLWHYQNAGERKLAIAVLSLAVVVPVSFHYLTRMASPLDPRSTAYLLSTATETPDQPGLGEALARAIAADDADPNPHMALGLVHEKAGHLGPAEEQYRLALDRHGEEGRIRNNLGNIDVRTGRIEQAIDEYQQAVKAAPLLAAPHFNLSRLYARRLQFDLADEEMRKASRLDFEVMRAALTATNQGPLELLSLGLSPAELWQATWNGPPTFHLGIPRSLGWLYGGSVGWLPLLTAILFAASYVGGRALFRFLPTYSCANCHTVVCRKCLRRIRRKAYCAHCGDTILSMQTSEFTRMLLERRLKEEFWGLRFGRFALKLLIPGWEAVRRGRPLVGLAIVGAFVTFAVWSITGGLPVPPVPALLDFGHASRWLSLIVGLLVLYALSGVLFRILPEPESSLLGTEVPLAPGRSDDLDRAA